MNKIKNYFTYDNIAVTLIILSILYVFQMSIIHYLVGSKAIFLGILGILSMLTILFMVKKSINIRGVLLMWIVFLFLTMLNNYDIRYETPSVYAHFLLAFCVMLVLSSRDNWTDRIFKFILIMSMFHAVFTIICFVFPDFYLNYVVNLFPNSKSFIIALYNENCISGLTGHYSTNGIYIAFATLFSFSLLLRKRNIVSVLTFLIALFALFLTGKRAQLLFSIISIAIMYLLSAKFKNKIKRLFIYGASGGTITLILSQFIPPLKTAIDRFTEAANITDLLNGRTYFWEASMDYFSTSPIIGIGWGGFKYNYYTRIGIYDSFNKFIDVHNVYLQILCELGILGFIVFIYIILKTLQKTFSHFKSSQENDKHFLCLSIGIQILFILYCFSGNPFYDIQFSLVYFITIAYTYSLGSNSIINKETFCKVWKFIKREIKK